MHSPDRPSHDPRFLPPGLPAPEDDGACDHLGREPFLRFPSDLVLPSTSGESVNLSEWTVSPTVLFLYPRTGVPGQPPKRGFSGEDWDEVPGARGCTPQSCGFRDAWSEFRRLGVQVFGISTQRTDFQREFKARMGLPFDLLSDAELKLTRALRLPTFEFPVESGGPNTLIKRLALFADCGAIVKVWYPVFPPDQNAVVVLDWLRRS